MFNLTLLQRHPLPLVAIALRTPGGLLGKPAGMSGLMEKPEGMPGLMGKPGVMLGFPILAPLSCSVLPLCSPLHWDRGVPMLFARLLQ